MAIDKGSAKDLAEEKKQPGDENAAPPAEAILAGSARDPDEATFAEDAIKSFVAQRLADFYEQIEAAVDSLEAWLNAQDSETRVGFNDRGYFDSLGNRYLEQLLGVAGGGGTPIMDALAAEVDTTVSWAQHAESDYTGFLNHVRRAARDATWVVRDNTASILSNQWPQLLDLATSGSYDFVPLLHGLGLPTVNFKAQDFGDGLVSHADAYRRALAPVKEEAVSKLPDDKKADVKDEAQQLALDDNKKQANQATF